MKKLSAVFDSIEERKKNVEFLPTGFLELDIVLDGGFIKREMVILGGRTGSGKSFVAGTIFHHIATQGFNSAYFSLEISNEMVVSRLIGAEANVQPTAIMMKKLEPDLDEKIHDAKAKVSVYEEFMHFYDDIWDFPKMKKEILENKYDFVVIDFIQNISVPGKEEYERLSFLAHSLQQLAKEADCCILVVSQLSNNMAKEKKDDVIEYKGSGEIGIVCDLGFYIEKGKNGYGTFNLHLRKNRRGVTGSSFPFELLYPSGRVVPGL